MNDATSASASVCAARIRAGELTSEALVRACLERIAAREQEVGAWAWLDPQAALEAARRADASPVRGPLHGVPIGVKDIIDTVDMPTGLGFAPYAQRRPSWDASCVAACRKAGAIILGKTVTTEFAYFAAGKTRNPRDLLATPGGSSSGSAAAVADGMVPLAFGSQTAGSLVRPAAFCGIFGYKASHGEFSLSGIRPFAESLDSLGVLARSIDDLALMRQVLLDRAGAPLPASPFGARSPRLGFCRTAQWTDMEPGARIAAENAVARLAAAGARVDAIALPPAFAPLIDAHRAIMAYEAAQNYLFEREQFKGQVSEAFMALCEAGLAISRTYYLRAREQVAQAKQEFRQLFAGYDAWIAPSALGEAPLASTGTGDPVMSRMWTALHAPCLAVPTERGERGLPLGVQLVAVEGNDDSLLDAGAWVARHIAEPESKPV
jgi:Asp-tRNA(Asn)/Glu-tRNA(Gln) amidotransferase A subunit family amidase